MKLSVTPADSLRLWQASSETDDEVKNGDEPGMQAVQWGAAASATSGVRSNEALGADGHATLPCLLAVWCPIISVPLTRDG